MDGPRRIKTVHEGESTIYADVPPPTEAEADALILQIIKLENKVKGILKPFKLKGE